MRAFHCNTHLARSASWRSLGQTHGSRGFPSSPSSIPFWPWRIPTNNTNQSNQQTKQQIESVQVGRRFKWRGFRENHAKESWKPPVRLWFNICAWKTAPFKCLLLNPRRTFNIYPEKEVEEEEEEEEEEGEEKGERERERKRKKKAQTETTIVEKAEGGGVRRESV